LFRPIDLLKYIPPLYSSLLPFSVALFISLSYFEYGENESKDDTSNLWKNEKKIIDYFGAGELNEKKIIIVNQKKD